MHEMNLGGIIIYGQRTIDWNWVGLSFMAREQFD